MRFKGVITTILVATTLVSCTQPLSQEESGTLTGAVVGGLVGSLFGSGTGQGLAAGAGTVAGAMIGNNIGKGLDQASAAEAQRGFNAEESTHHSTWHDNQGAEGTSYKLTTYPPYTKNGKTCRRYHSEVIHADGSTVSSQGLACRSGHDDWVIAE